MPKRVPNRVVAVVGIEQLQREFGLTGSEAERVNRSPFVGNVMLTAPNEIEPPPPAGGHEPQHDDAIDWSVDFLRIGLESDEFAAILTDLNERKPKGGQE